MHSRVVGFMMRHPVGVVLAAMLGVVCSLLYTATHLAFDSNRLDLVSAGEHYTKLDAAFNRQFEDLPGSMVVVLQSQYLERAKAFAAALAQRWETDPHIAKVFYRINVDALKRKGLLYLSPMSWPIFASSFKSITRYSRSWPRPPRCKTCSASSTRR
jgi:hypothetical protein